MRARAAALVALLLLGPVPRAHATDVPTQPPLVTPYRQLRFDETYAALCSGAPRTDYLDAVKCVPFNADASRYLTFGGEVRERYEYYRNGFWGLGPQDDTGYLLQRYMLHADVHFGDAVRVFAQLKSGLESGRNGGPRPTDQDDFDLHQAFVDVRLAGLADGTVTLRVGRQELSYGSSRLVSFREGPNVRLSFDALKAIWNVAGWQVDVFAARPVRTKTGVLDDDADPNQKFWGLYAVTPISWLPGGRVDLYYLGLERHDAHFDQGTADERRHTVGTRLWGEKAGWDYNFEFVYQFGTFGTGDIEAWTAASDIGFTFESAAFRPRVGLRANITSGDHDPGSPDLQTFNALFPRGAYFGEPALIGPANHIDLHPEIDLRLHRTVTLIVDWDFFWRESTRDGIYGPAVNLIQSGQTSDARYVGSQAEAMLEWRPDRHFTVTADYAHFFAGPFLTETTPGKDVDYFSAWITYRF